MSDSRKRLPPRDGVNPSAVQLLAGPWPTLLDALDARFPAVGRERWLSRFVRGLVIDDDGVELTATTPHERAQRVRYYREVPDEISVPFAETIVHAGDELLVVDKPHFLPVVPAGRHVAETLLARLITRFGEPDLVPLHRIDAATAGLVLFSRNPATRSAWLALFRERRIDKHYEAVAAPLPDVVFPLTRRSRIARGEPFVLSREIDGDPNAETHIDVIERGERWWRYALQPVTGRKHQLRLHMAALGAPLRHDEGYPVFAPRADGDFSRPLQLLAKSLAFDDPLDGTPRHYTSQRVLLPLDAGD